MSKKKYKKKPSGVSQQPVAKAQSQPAVELAPSQLNLILPAAVAIITFIVYRFTLNNQFLNWDDWIYVQKDPFITSFSAHNLKMMLFHNITRNYFHPITMLSLALNYHFSKMDPWGYYFTNILIHAANTVVIYFFTKKLLENMSQRYDYGNIKGIPWLSALSALFLAVHPMHVESVAWMCERKDVLYALFYFLGLIMYINYVNENKLKWMLLVVGFYGCSLLSKPMAVCFPLSLFAIDLLLKKDKGKQDLLKDFTRFTIMGIIAVAVTLILLKSKLINNWVIDSASFLLLLGAGLYFVNKAIKESTSILFMEKYHLILISIVGGVITFYTQKESGSIAFLHGFTLLHKLTVPFYSFLMYFVKAFVPFKLSSYYPYPSVTKDGYIPFFFYICPLLAAALVLVPLYLAWKYNKNYFRVLLFGFGFYFANVVFILQFLSSGVAIMAERYSYVAYFGIFFMVVYFIGNIIQKMPSYKVPVIALTAVFVSGLAYVCDGRTKSWHDSESFWHDVIRKYPRQWLVPYMNLAQYYIDNQKMDSAFVYYQDLAELHSTEPETYRNLANLYGMRKDYDKSLALYKEALKYDSTGGADIYLDRAVTLSIMGRLDSAILDYNRAYAKDSNSEKILGNRAYAYLSTGQFDKSIKDYNHLIRLNAGDPTNYFRRGLAEANSGNLQAALKDYTSSLEKQPNNPDCLYNMSLAYKALKDYSNALNYAIKARQAGYKVEDTYISDLQKSAGTSK